ncbi:insulinase family protein [Synoicihabitans lomoniglobus]|uniref:Protease 3 n=1 Tax=Synoicihabitans lomoniglobus TaxID=2909285 RepID=A0AAF0CML8_9BACT|nr:insulinase family protein [Opitutaceae bacterium LMO-M01]WED64323.1 insulinase family protein [Opitutaceae bacterium LMO-M01]
MTRPSLTRLALASLLSFAPIATFATSPTEAPDLPARVVAPTDKAQFSRLVLDNGLRVLLVSDPAFNKSAASLAVGIGQLEDPEETTGIAHFTEHMLFLGTEKYPDEGEYGTFVKSNGGYTNAYTSSDLTNYQFEVRHEAFDAALDRFAQFFIAPLFTPKFTEREISAVHNEVMRHVQNDGRRIYNVMRELYAPGSPESRFTAGNKETLATADSPTVRAFFEANYSAERMALALTGNASLAELETMARTHFSAIPNRGLPSLERSSTFLPRQAALRLAQVEPVREVRELQLQFPLDATRANFTAKNAETIRALLSHSSAGGITHALKEAGLALSAGGSIWDRSPDYSSLFIYATLTPGGADRLPEVFDLIFEYIDFLRTAPFPHALWSENARIARLGETYNDRGEGASLAIELANQALFFPLAVAERVPHVWVAPDEADYRNILDQLTPDNLLAVFAAKGVPTDRTEHFYGSAYSYTEDTGPAYQRLLDVRAPTDGTFALPRPNPYLGAEPELLTERPVQLIDEPGLALYYAPDLEFLRPQTTLRFRLVPTTSHTDVRTATLLALYDQCLGDALDAAADEAARAGVSFNVGASLHSFNLTVTGFGDSPVRFAREAVSQLHDVAPSAERFAALKDGFLRNLRSFPQTEAFRLAGARRGAWTEEYSYLPDEMLAPALAATWPEVKAAADAFLRAGKLEGVIHGHLAPDHAIAAARELVTGIGFTPAPADQLLRSRELTQADGETIIDVAPTAGANSAYTALYLLPDASPRHRAAGALLGNFISQPFFNELRTRQQLGYIVGAGGSGTRLTRYLSFTIQSSDYGPDELRTRAEAFIATLPDALAALPAADFAQLVGGVRANFEAKPKSLAEKTDRFFAYAYDYDADWERQHDALDALESLTQADAAALLTDVLTGSATRRRLVLLTGENHEASTAPASFTDRATWKASRRFQ